MKRKKRAVFIVSMIYLALIVVFGFSWNNHAGENSGDRELVAPIIGKPKVIFSAGSFPVDSEELTLVVQGEELDRLNRFPALKAVDLSGSTCYEEIAAWAAANHGVAVRFTVAMPDGSAVENGAERLDLSTYDADTAAQAAALCKYLPKLKEIDLGTMDSARIIDPEAVSLMRESCPDAQLKYRCTFAGQTVDSETESISLAGMSHDEVVLAAQLLPGMSGLKTVDLGYEGDGGVSWEDIGLLQNACPNILFGYGFNRFGQELNINCETLDFNHIAMKDEGAEVRSFLPYMKNCSYLDMDFCNVSNGAMEAIRNDYPEMKVVWRIWFGQEYSVRTDVERILASKPTKGGNLNNKQTEVLRYCTDIKYLDLGHNLEITDISFVRSMPKLEVFIIAMNEVSDISPLADCPHLEYLALNATEVADLSPLSELSELRHINIGNCPTTDISPLYGLKDLERLWIGCNTPVPAEQVEKMRECAPNCEINADTFDPEGGRWRVTGYTELSLALYEETGWLQEVLHPRYALLREQLGFTDVDYAFHWNDPKY